MKERYEGIPLPALRAPLTKNKTCRCEALKLLAKDGDAA
jgi:hypothetical protein